MASAGVSDWLFTPVYASPNADQKRILWLELQQLAGSVSEQWIVAGDFNDISCFVEKKRGAPSFIRRCNLFAEHIDGCHLMDMGAIWPKFSWRGPLFNGHNRVFEHLDRALCNDSVRINYPEGFVKVLPRVYFSDHHPLMIYPCGQPYARSDTQFCFEKVWLTHPTYFNVVQEQWRPHEDLAFNLAELEEKLQE